MSNERVTYAVEDQVAFIGLNRADKRNAIDDEMSRQLRGAVFRAGEEARAGVIFAHGDNFSAGLDLAEALGFMDPNTNKRPRRGRWNRSFDLIARGPIPWLAALKGACVGGGLELAAACHIRVADETTFFALPEGQRGLFVGGGGSVRVARLMGYARMADLMLTGRVLTATEGERANLAQYIVPAGESLARAKSLAGCIAQNAPASNWAIANVLPRIMDLSHENGLFVESITASAMRDQGSEREQRLRDFVEKRAPRLARPGTSGDGQ